MNPGKPPPFFLNALPSHLGIKSNIDLNSISNVQKRFARLYKKRGTRSENQAGSDLAMISNEEIFGRFVLHGTVFEIDLIGDVENSYIMGINNGNR